jgi:hypothetical protein
MRYYLRMAVNTWATRGLPIADKLAYYSKPSLDGCRVWTAAVAGGGYGQIWHKGRSALAHRLALELKLGRRIKADREAAHTCHNRLCINPEHLEEATHRKNIDDRMRSGRGAVGERVGGAKLTAAIALQIRSDPRSERELSRVHGVSRNVIGEIKRRRIWKHLPS